MSLSQKLIPKTLIFVIHFHPRWETVASIHDQYESREEKKSFNHRKSQSQSQTVFTFVVSLKRALMVRVEEVRIPTMRFRGRTRKILWKIPCPVCTPQIAILGGGGAFKGPTIEQTHHPVVRMCVSVCGCNAGQYLTPLHSQVFSVANYSPLLSRDK